MSDAIIEIENLSKVYASEDGPVRALDRVSLKQRRGEFVSIVGPSGCGKTTSLNLLAGLLLGHPEGEARVLSKSPHPGNPDVAYMLARDSLLPWRTALGNAAYGLEIRGAPRRQCEERARRCSSASDLPTLPTNIPRRCHKGCGSAVLWPGRLHWTVRYS